MKIDHIAIQVNDIQEACEWYKSKFEAIVLYCDETWGILEFDNTKLALTLPEKHPNHFAIEVNPENYPNLEFKEHRDGSKFHYLKDPWGNCLELINYGRTSENNS